LSGEVPPRRAVPESNERPDAVGRDVAVLASGAVCRRAGVMAVVESGERGPVMPGAPERPWSTLEENADNEPVAIMRRIIRRIGFRPVNSRGTVNGAEIDVK
jgi:hypothetical protein